eukprot:TRINITY_DN5987_c0_g1_i2.p1 TRINITY_DN5987_c0_g1~~TRINITY_DN5987_c0_g1_i2.p1  ORF type:complete len:404 (+),score=64.47 TRINITY_DN5987_c0_g1_i2:283-1494(+)
MNHLDYILGMGFDAIWISPVIKNTPGGYHGYWAEDWYEINPHFGTREELKALVQACHAKGIWVMVDVVANHVGPVGYNYTTINPFNKATHYHGCDQCPPGCSISDWNNLEQIQMCRLAGLPDLDQSNNFVRETLYDWIRDLVSDYDLDGIRIDTIPEIKPDFWSGYAKSAGVFQIGEAYNGNTNFVASYQDVIDSVFSYPMFFTLRDVFAYKHSMYNIQNTLKEYKSAFKDLSVLGNFIDNHDQARFLSVQPDLQLYKNGLTYTLLSEGIPFVYYGTEQGYAGGNDPYNREPLWPNYKNSSELYQFISTVNKFRQNQNIQDLPQIQRYADDNFYAFSRGQVFVATTNVGSNSGTISREITYHPYADGTKICNIFWPTSDCITVQNGKFTVYLLNGESKIYHPV